MVIKRSLIYKLNSQFVRKITEKEKRKIKKKRKLLLIKVITCIFHVLFDNIIFDNIEYYYFITST